MAFFGFKIYESQILFLEKSEYLGSEMGPLPSWGHLWHQTKHSIPILFWFPPPGVKLALLLSAINRSPWLFPADSKSESVRRENQAFLSNAFKTSCSFLPPPAADGQPLPLSNPIRARRGKWRAGSDYSSVFCRTHNPPFSWGILQVGLEPKGRFWLGGASLGPAWGRMCTWWAHLLRACHLPP